MFFNVLTFPFFSSSLSCDKVDSRLCTWCKMCRAETNTPSRDLSALIRSPATTSLKRSICTRSCRATRTSCNLWAHHSSIGRKMHRARRSICFWASCARADRWQTAWALRLNLPSCCGCSTRRRKLLGTCMHRCHLSPTGT